MPSSTAKNRPGPARRHLRAVRNHLGAVGDIWITLEETEDFATAERLGIEFGEDFRLLEDIGWSSEDDRHSFDFTMPAHDLMELLQTLPRRSRARPARIHHRARVKGGRRRHR